MWVQKEILHTTWQMKEIVTKIDKWIYSIELYTKYPDGIFCWNILMDWESYTIRIKMKNLDKLQEDMTVYLHQSSREKSKYYQWPLRMYLKTLDYLYY